MFNELQNTKFKKKSDLFIWLLLLLVINKKFLCLCIHFGSGCVVRFYRVRVCVLLPSLEPPFNIPQQLKNQVPNERRKKKQTNTYTYIVSKVC